MLSRMQKGEQVTFLRVIFNALLSAINFLFRPFKVNSSKNLMPLYRERRAKCSAVKSYSEYLDDLYPTFSSTPNLSLENVGVVIPTFNEEKNIGDVVSQLKRIGYNNILIIDGLSKDATIKVAMRKGAKIVLQRDRGKGQAIRQVLSNNYLQTDYLVLMDADGSMDPREVPRFIKALKDGADVAKGTRFLSGGGTFDMSALRRFGNKLMTLSVNVLAFTSYTDICYGFLALNRKAIEMLSPILKSDKFEIEAEIFIKAKQTGLKVVEVPSVEYMRKNGKSNLHSFKDGTKIFKTIFRSIFNN